MDKFFKLKERGAMEEQSILQACPPFCDGLYSDGKCQYICRPVRRPQKDQGQLLGIAALFVAMLLLTH